MDFSNFLILYSGGADSTYFIEKEETAKHLIHFKSRNQDQTNVAITNANILDRHLNIVRHGTGTSGDGETNQIHALYDTEMALHASIIALSYGMKGIVMGFNADDLGIDTESIEKIIRRADPQFQLLQPLRAMKASDIRSALRTSTLKTVSCMNAFACGYCAKCRRSY